VLLGTGFRALRPRFIALFAAPSIQSVSVHPGPTFFAGDYVKFSVLFDTEVALHTTIHYDGGST
jgi:hypothetical protein